MKEEQKKRAHEALEEAFKDAEKRGASGMKIEMGINTEEDSCPCEDEKSKYVYKSFPMKKGWKPLYADLDKQAEDLMEKTKLARDKALAILETVKDGFHRLEARKKLFWSTVEIDMGLENEDLHYNEETGEIEVMRERK